MIKFETVGGTVYRFTGEKEKDAANHFERRFSAIIDGNRSEGEGGLDVAECLNRLIEKTSEKFGVVIESDEENASSDEPKPPLWYAVMKDREDIEHGYGSNDLEEAKEMCREMKEDYPDAFIAVISPADDFCLDEIEVECEAKYRVKDEFVYNWTNEDVDELVVTLKEIEDLAKGWAVSVEELMEQVEEV